MSERRYNRRYRNSAWLAIRKGVCADLPSDMAADALTTILDCAEWVAAYSSGDLPRHQRTGFRGQWATLPGLLNILSLDTGVKIMTFLAEMGAKDSPEEGEAQP